MAAQAHLGKHHREGLTVIQLLRFFPNDRAAEKWFEEQRWPEERCCPDCGFGQHCEDEEPETHALPVPRLPETLQRPQGHGHAVFQDRLPEVGHRHST